MSLLGATTGPELSGPSHSFAGFWVYFRLEATSGVGGRLPASGVSTD